MLNLGYIARVDLRRGRAKPAPNQLDLFAASSVIQVVEWGTNSHPCSGGVPSRTPNGKNGSKPPSSQPSAVSTVLPLYVVPFVINQPPSPTPPWWKLAACAGYIPPPNQPDIFFPERGESDAVAQAKKVCSRCPVALPCLIDGLRESYGVFGGMTVLEREDIRRRVRAMPVIKTFWSPCRNEPGWCIDCGKEGADPRPCQTPGARNYDPFSLWKRPRREQEERRNNLAEISAVSVGEHVAARA